MSLNICMISDFFYPNMGGVESHLYHLSQQLIKRGHKVIIVTHAYGDRVGVRYLINGLKVYYIPLLIVYQQASLPTLFFLFPILRYIIIRERIDIVHGHQAFSSLCLEGIFHARTMGIKACFTDHSLFGFADASSILTNKVLKFTLSEIDHVICVSHTSKGNTVLRASLNPQMVSVIPNAVVANHFIPDPSKADPNKITICVVSRLVYRKGMDLLTSIIPRICTQHPKVNFIIAGDGPKKIDLEQMREKYLLHDRVQLLGAVPHSEVKNVLVRGNIFLNTSLTEAFCIGIVEAACSGLLVVSTRVGGVPEVLPDDMIIFAEPEENDLITALSKAITMIKFKEVTPAKFHDRIKKMYSWENIAERTERVYYSIMKTRRIPLIERLRRYYGCGSWAGKLFCIIAAVDYLIFLLLEYLVPRNNIEIVPNFPSETFLKRQKANNYY